MMISISTANLYDIPFERVLAIYKRAGFEHIELAGYWKGGEWEIAQHLKGYEPGDVIRLVKDAGLKISTYHDMGGVVEAGAESIVSDNTWEYLQYYDFPCLVFHTPHMKNADEAWWQAYRQRAIEDLHRVQGTGERIISIENLPPLPPQYSDYFMPLTNPAELLDFVNEANIGLNLDTTHYAVAGVDISDAARLFGKRVKTIHASDYQNGRQHVHLGEGGLDFAAFFGALHREGLHSVCAECAIAHDPLDDDIAVASAAQAREFLERILL